MRSCALPPSTAATLTLLGLTNPIANTYLANTFSVKTSADSTSVVNPGAAVVVAAATTPTAVTVAGTSLALSARATWTTNFTTSATGALHDGDKITVTYPAGFVVPATPSVLLVNGFSNCSATATGAGTVGTVTLADNGGSCTLASSNAATIQLLGVTNGTTTGAVTATVKTSTDTTAANAAAVTMVAATTPTGVTIEAATLSASSKTTWTTNFTASASGGLRAGDTITVTYPTNFVVQAGPDDVLFKTGFINCVGTVTGSVTVATITLANNGGTCALPNGADASFQLLGVTNRPTTGAITATVKTSSDTTAATSASVTLVAATSVTAFTVASSSLNVNARATWTFNFTTSGTGNLRDGNSITATFPAGFAVPANPTIIPLFGFAPKCTLSATGAGQVVTITLANNGTSCFQANGSVLELQILGVTNGPTTGAVQPTIKTSNDTTTVSATAVTMVAATTPTAVSFASTTLAANARSTWAVGFTSTASGDLQDGDTVTVAFPNATSVFTVPANPTVLLTKGFKNCAVASAVTATTTVTITLDDSGGVCSLPISTAAQVQILGVKSGAAGTVATTNWSVKTSADTTAGVVGAAIVIAAATTPTAVTFASTTLAAQARATWTVGFTSTATGALRTGDTLSVAFPNATSIFTVPANPIVLLTKGFKNCAVASAVTATTTVTITLTDNGGVCSLPISTAAQVQILGVKSGAAGTVTAANWNVKTSADTTAGVVGASIVISAATTPTAVTSPRRRSPRTRAAPGTSASPRARRARSRSATRSPSLSPTRPRSSRCRPRRPSSSRRASSTALQPRPERRPRSRSRWPTTAASAPCRTAPSHSFRSSA